MSIGCSRLGFVKNVIALGLLVALAAPASAREGSVRERIRERVAGRKNAPLAQTVTNSATVETIRVGEATRTYRLHVPAAHLRETYAASLSFRGLNSNAARGETLTGLSTLADKEGLIAVYPEGAADDQCILQADDEVIDDEDDATGEQWVCGRHVVVPYTLKGKVHSWPGSSMPARITSSDVHATATMWAFFQQCHARQPEQSGGHP